MTEAICLQCGQIKWGAWVPCPACGYQPVGAKELDMAIWVSDHYIPHDKLTELAARRQQGEPWNLEELVKMSGGRLKLARRKPWWRFWG